ncbi:putative Serine/threonine-protein kinase [Triangularia setosa]|uniref:Serine/threonine-protein kinase n=1 Tax=Triangularia setosa TaxID=2587417 RepID=A0AAN7A2D0_9PEZI|nr:putative Serine/threonine-protein kinase [Podospora setosa]
MEPHTPIYIQRVDEAVSHPAKTPLASTRQVSNSSLTPSRQVTRDSPHTSANGSSKDQSDYATEYSDSDSNASSSSLESSDNEGPIALQGGLEKPCTDDFMLNRKCAIDESDSELRELEERTPSSGRKSPQVNYTARAPFRGDGGVPAVELHRTLVRETEPSEITDLGNGLHYRDPDRKVRFLQRKKGRCRTKDRKSLQTRLFESLHPLYDEEKEKGFIPVDQLPHLITEDSVYEELSSRLRETHDEKTIRRYARKICAETTEHHIDGEKPKATAITFRKIFATLVLVEKASAITKFLKENINDSDLPLIRVRNLKRPGECDLRCSRKPDKRLKCFKGGWSPLQIRNFADWQFITLAPFFAKSELYKEVNHYVLQDRVIMPFLTDPNKRNPSDDPFVQSQQEELLGGGGRVFRAILHPDHHSFHNSLKCPRTPCICTFAIKRLHSQDKKQFKREVDMLKKFSNDAHPHLISLLATYEQRNSYFLMFPCAKADLFAYWQKFEPTPKIDHNTVKWVAEQCKGIASGVLKIHEYASTNSKLGAALMPNPGEPFGHHGDIKPENVLFFPDSKPTPDQLPQADADHRTKSQEDDLDDDPHPIGGSRGTLKLTDFGLASTSAHRTMSRMPRSHLGMTYNYRAPECDLPCSQDPKGRQYDMWTLGCLYLEFVTWLMGGKRLLNEFTNLRARPSEAESLKHKTRLDIFYGGGLIPAEITSDTFFKIVEDNSIEGQKRGGLKGIVKPAVTEFIKRLHADPRCTQFVHDFLDMIQDGLLAIKQLDPQKLDRYEIQQVYGKLCRMDKQCEKWEYSCKPRPGQ